MHKEKKKTHALALKSPREDEAYSQKLPPCFEGESPSHSFRREPEPVDISLFPMPGKTVKHKEAQLSEKPTVKPVRP